MLPLPFVMYTCVAVAVVAADVGVVGDMMMLRVLKAMPLCCC